MTSMKEQNEVLYYAVCEGRLFNCKSWVSTDADVKVPKLIQKHLKEMFPVIYTPTEGEAIAEFSRLFRRPDGCFLNIFDQDRIEQDLGQWGNPDDIDLIVVSDGEQVRSSPALTEYCFTSVSLLTN